RRSRARRGGGGPRGGRHPGEAPYRASAEPGSRQAGAERSLPGGSRGADGGRTLWARGRIPGILSGVLVQQAVDEGAVLAQGEAEGLGVRVGRGLPGAAQREIGRAHV